MWRINQWLNCCVEFQRIVSDEPCLVGPKVNWLRLQLIMIAAKRICYLWVNFGTIVTRSDLVKLFLLSNKEGCNALLSTRPEKIARLFATGRLWRRVGVSVKIVGWGTKDGEEKKGPKKSRGKNEFVTKTSFKRQAAREKTFKSYSASEVKSLFVRLGSQ